MFLDIAFILRALLRTMGYENPEVIGICVVPSIDRNPSRTLALGNTFAALTELNHFSAPGSTFTAFYDDREKPLVDSEAPFARTILYPLAEDADSHHARDTLGPVTDFLARDLMSLGA